jgi:chromosome segregation ATPase
MNNLLFTALIIALLYYFFYYLPSQKKLTHPILTQSQFTQTEPTLIKNQDLEIKELQEDIQQKERTIIGLNNSYDKLETKKDDEIKQLKNQITNLQAQIRELVKRPLKPTNSKSTQTDSETELTNTLDTLIKDIQQLNNSL